MLFVETKITYLKNKGLVIEVETITSGNNNSRFVNYRKKHNYSVGMLTINFLTVSQLSFETL